MSKRVPTGEVGGPTSGVPNDRTVIWDEKTLAYPPGFPCVDGFETDR